MIEVPRLMFVPALPANLKEMLEAQVRRLIEVGLPKEVGVDEAKFLDDAMAMADEFAFSTDLAAIQLDQVWMVHYGVRDRFLMLTGGVTEWTNPDKFTLYEGVAVPDGLRVEQGQLGLKYKNIAPRDVRQEHDPLEQLGVPKEGLTAFLYWGKDLLRESYMDFPGAVSECGFIPYLRLYDEKPVLSDYSAVYADPFYGSVSVSRGS